MAINMNPTRKERTVTTARLKRLDSPDGYVIVIHQRDAVSRIYGPNTKAMVDVYMRGLKENNPGAYQNAVVMPPRGSIPYGG